MRGRRGHEEEAGPRGAGRPPLCLCCRRLAAARPLTAEELLGGRDGGGVVRAARSTGPRVETTVGCKTTAMKAVWASLRFKGPAGNAVQESLWGLHLSDPARESQWQASGRSLRSASFG